MKILDVVLDCDGVMGDLVSEVLEMYRLEKGVHLTHEDVIVGNFTKFDIHGPHLMRYLKNPSVFKTMKPYEWAQELADWLLDCGHNVYVCTAVDYEFIEIRANWLKENFPRINEDNYIFTKNKSLITGDVSIDDGIHNLFVNKTKNKVLLSQPWNRKINQKYESTVFERTNEENHLEFIKNLISNLAYEKHILEEVS